MWLDSIAKLVANSLWWEAG